MEGIEALDVDSRWRTLRHSMSMVDSRWRTLRHTLSIVDGGH